MLRQDNSASEALRELAARVRGTAVERRGIAVFAGSDRSAMSAAADALAKEAGATLYRVDLNRIVSKYIGETEKNLDAVFRDAEAGGAILFFDEADALFGSRTDVKDSHDRYANVDIGYLLKRLEAFSGLAILATNHREALDAAIARRVNYFVDFQG